MSSQDGQIKSTEKASSTPPETPEQPELEDKNEFHQTSRSKSRRHAIADVEPLVLPATIGQTSSQPSETPNKSDDTSNKTKADEAVQPKTEKDSKS